eukprot:TRINITY_DN1306_c0_g2_i2.p1 TRINITY_DN1306_c0_g2~~TRINITY_DN1306_c0_g2_i2.p1  ORF type:complete len:477 (-),score=84.53 TRINITY_DN1306_c0_g2_i2:89-1414(-)
MCIRDRSTWGLELKRRIHIHTQRQRNKDFYSRHYTHIRERMLNASTTQESRYCTTIESSRALLGIITLIPMFAWSIFGLVADSVCAELEIPMKAFFRLVSAGLVTLICLLDIFTERCRLKAIRQGDGTATTTNPHTQSLCRRFWYPTSDASCLHWSKFSFPLRAIVMLLMCFWHLQVLNVTFPDSCDEDQGMDLLIFNTMKIVALYGIIRGGLACLLQMLVWIKLKADKEEQEERTNRQAREREILELPNTKNYYSMVAVEIKAEKIMSQTCRECVICLTEFKAAETVCVLKCNYKHVFHEECIKSWYDTSATCPICRKDFQRRPRNKAFPSSLKREEIQFSTSLQACSVFFRLLSVSQPCYEWLAYIYTYTYHFFDVRSLSALFPLPFEQFECFFWLSQRDSILNAVVIIVISYLLYAVLLFVFREPVELCYVMLCYVVI